MAGGARWTGDCALTGHPLHLSNIQGSLGSSGWPIVGLIRNQHFLETRGRGGVCRGATRVLATARDAAVFNGQFVVADDGFYSYESILHARQGLAGINEKITQTEGEI